MGKDVLLGKAGGRDGLEAGEKFLVRGVLALGFGQGDVVELVVVAIVAVRGRGFRRGFQVGLILLLKERVLRGNSRMRRKRAGRRERLEAERKSKR